MARESDLATRAAMHESIHHVTKRVLRSMFATPDVHCTCRTNPLSVETTENGECENSLLF